MIESFSDGLSLVTLNLILLDLIYGSYILIVCNRWSKLSKRQDSQVQCPMSNLSVSEKGPVPQTHHPVECLEMRCHHNIPIQSKVPAR